jgi:general secretion pathway protein C
VDLDSLVKKYFAGVVLCLVALSAYFQAAGATQLVGAALGAGGPSASAVPAGASRGPGHFATGHENKNAEPIIARNPFDSVTGPLYPKPEEAVVPTPTELVVTDPLGAPGCDGVQVFIVTESTDPLWSVAALQGPGEPHPRMRRVGDDVGGKQVAFIGFNPRENSPSVWFQGGASLCQTLLFKTQGAPQAAPAAAPVAPAPSEAAPPPSRGASPLPADIASKIQKVSDTEFNVDRSVVDKILENQADLMRSARIVPESKDGKVVGIRMFGIRPDTLLGTLGMQNGDRLESINGFNMSSPEKALEAYARLRTASNLNVKLNRRGSPVSIDYRIK